MARQNAQVGMAYPVLGWAYVLSHVLFLRVLSCFVQYGTPNFEERGVVCAVWQLRWYCYV